MSKYYQKATPSTGGSIDAPKVRGWMSLRDFAQVADVTYMTMLRWARLGMINCTQVGGQRRVYQEEIARFLRDGTLPPEPEAWQKEKDKRAQWLKPKPKPGDSSS